MLRTSRLAFLLVPTLVVVLVLLSGGGARAVEPVPPVPEFPALPSTAQKAVTGSPMANQVIASMKALFLSGAVGGVPTAGTVATTPKLVAGATVVARGAGGSLLLPFYIGYTLGQGGLEVYAQATGTSRDSLICNTSPTWFQAGSAFISAGLVGGCQGAIPTASQNPDAATAPNLTYGGTSVTHSGRSAANSSLGGSAGIPLNQPYVWCYTGTVTLPAGSELQQKWSGTNYPGDLWKGVTLFTSSAGQYGCGTSSFQGDGAANGSNGAGALSSTLRLVNTSTGSVLATMVAGSGNPTRQLRCTITWADGTMTTGTGQTYNEGAGLPVSMEGTGCKEAETSKAPGAGGQRVLPDRIKVDSDNGGAITEVANTDVPTFSPTEAQSMSPNVTAGLKLLKVVDGVESSCMTWEANCVDWWAATNSATTTTTATGTYRCTYNNATVTLGECGIYRHTFDTRTSTPTLTEPSTGEQVPWVTGAPSPLNSLNPGVGPGVDPGGECMASWPASPDPLSWVMHPVKCALVWAFVPRTSVVTAMQTTISTAWAPTMVGQLPGIVTDAFTPPDALEGCEGPHVYMDFTSYFDGWPVIDMYPLNACVAPMSEVAALARALGAGILIYLTALGMVRRISAIVNAPGLGGAS